MKSLINIKNYCKLQTDPHALRMIELVKHSPKNKSQIIKELDISNRITIPKKINRLIEFGILTRFTMKDSKKDMIKLKSGHNFVLKKLYNKKMLKRNEVYYFFNWRKGYMTLILNELDHRLKLNEDNLIKETLDHYEMLFISDLLAVKSIKNPPDKIIKSKIIVPLKDKKEYEKLNMEEFDAFSSNIFKLSKNLGYQIVGNKGPHFTEDGKEVGVYPRIKLNLFKIFKKIKDKTNQDLRILLKEINEELRNQIRLTAWLRQGRTLRMK